MFNNPKGSTFEGLDSCGPLQMCCLMTVCLFFFSHNINVSAKESGQRSKRGSRHRSLLMLHFFLPPGPVCPVETFFRVLWFSRPKPPPWGLLSWPKPPLAWDWRGLAMLKCEPDVSLCLAAPPVPPVLFFFRLGHCTGFRAAPHARARCDVQWAWSETSVVRQELRPRTIFESGLRDGVEQVPDIFGLYPVGAFGLVAANGEGVCDPPV